MDENTYIVATGGGVFYTNDGGHHWTSENSGLDNFDVTSLFADQHRVLAGTNGSGIFKTSWKI